jgi:hypothetical protein
MAPFSVATTSIALTVHALFFLRLFNFGKYFVVDTNDLLGLSQPRLLEKFLCFGDEHKVLV